MSNTPKKSLPSYYYVVRILLILIVIGLIAAAIINYLLKPSPLSFMEEGQLAFLESRWEDSRNAFEIVIAQEPNNPEGYIGRGIAYVKLGKPEDAIPDFERAIELDPDGDVRPYQQLGNIAKVRSNWDDALEYYGRIIEIAGEDHEVLADAYYNQGIAYAALFEYEKALENFKIAVELDDSVADYYRRVGDSYYILEEFGEALNAYQQYLSVEVPDDIRSYVPERVQELQGRD